VKASSSSDTSLTMDAKLAEEVAKFQKNLFGFSILNPNLKGNPELGQQNISCAKLFRQKNSMPL
jgi:hypothetical protein